MASLNIKNEETYRLVHELADLTGENMITAVTEAVRERLDRVRAKQGTGLAER
jgi:antitoxin VapB